MSIRVARAFMVLGILLPCNMVLAQVDTPFLPVNDPEQQAVMATSRASPPATTLARSRELEKAVADAQAAIKDVTREADLGQQLGHLICDNVKADAAHDSPGYRLVEDRARACMDDVNLSRNLGLKTPEPAAGGKALSGDHRAYLSCMARECETRVVTKLFGASDLEK